MIRFRIHTSVISALFFAALAGSAQAAPITVDWGLVDRVRQSPAPETRDGWFFVVPNDGPGLITDWRVTVSASNIGQTFVVTETTAAAQGLNWSLLESALLDANNHRFGSWTATPGEPALVFPPTATGLPRTGTPAVPGGQRYRFTNVEEVRFTLHEYFSTPLESLIRTQHQVIGQGTFEPIPEPATCGLSMISIGLMILHRNNRV
ncbi:MAG: hypothetical protein WD669_04200 [Pirellulales bacterium]